MKSIAILASSLLLATADESNLRGSERELGYATRREGWTVAHNTRRANYHDVPLTWSTGLRREALTLAKQMASTCTPAIPSDMQYGINVNGRRGYPNVPTTEWVLKQWESKIDDEENNGMIVQALWSGTEYFGCADSYNSVDKCSVSVCLYAKVRFIDLLCLYLVFYLEIEGSLLVLL